MITREEIQAILATYFSDKPVHRAYLFGSFARNEADEKSDIDVLIDLDYDRPGSIWGAYVGMMNELAERLGRKVDLVTSDSLSKYIAPYIHRDKVLVYER